MIGTTNRPLSQTIQEILRANNFLACDRLRVGEGCRESRRCSRDTYPESYFTKYTSIQRQYLEVARVVLRVPAAQLPIVVPPPNVFLLSVFLLPNVFLLSVFLLLNVFLLPQVGHVPRQFKVSSGRITSRWHESCSVCPRPSCPSSFLPHAIISPSVDTAIT